MAGTHTSGNRTARRGSRYIQRFQVDRDTAQTYKILVLQRGLSYTPENVAKIAAELAEEKWRAIDAQIQKEADAEWEGEAL